METGKCYIAKTDRIATTDGQKETILICYCGTTVCQKLSNNFQFYSLPSDFSKETVFFTKEESKKIHDTFWKSRTAERF